MYLNDWDNLDEMVSSFGIDKGKLEGCNVLLASYAYENYEGGAFVLFEKEGKLYEVNGAHCSCHGLESQTYYGAGDTQWEPEETTREALQHRADNGLMYCGREYKKELIQVLSNLKQ